MSHPWEAEQTISKEVALAAIQAQFPDLNAETIRLLGAGWDNTAFILNEAFIFRFPRREISLALLEIESAVLPIIAPRLPLPIPLPEWRGVPDAHFPWPFLGYCMLQGDTACYLQLSEPQRADLAEGIAHFLKALHAIPLKLLPSTLLKNNQHDMDGQVLTQKIRTNVKELASLGLLENEAQLETTLAGLQNFRKPLDSVIVHGDFHIRHLLVDKSKKLCGVIDWGDVQLGDPARDLSIAHSFLPHVAHNRFIKAYGPISHATWDLAKLRALYSATMLAIFGHHSQDAALLREGLRALRVMCQK